MAWICKTDISQLDLTVQIFNKLKLLWGRMERNMLFYVEKFPSKLKSQFLYVKKIFYIQRFSTKFYVRAHFVHEFQFE